MDKAEVIERLEYLKARAQLALEQEVPEWIAEDVLGTIEAYDMAIEALQTEPKRGGWIPCTKSGLPLTELMRRDGKKWYGYRCSNCNHIYKGNALTDCNFCPNCGADMREREGE